MFRIVTFSAFTVIAASSALAQGNVHVDGYTRRDGTYVPPHYRTTPDNSRTNNYNAQGNYNPYTGQAGRVDPYRPNTNTNNFGASNNFGQQRRGNGF